MDTAHRSRPGVLARWFELGPAEAGRLLPMEGLRGLAVILVFFVHYGSQLGQTFGLPLPGAGAALQHLGHAGVDLFFILSGYLIYGTLIRRPRPFAGYLARRVQRLCPAFLVVLALHLALALASRSGGGLPPGGWERAAVILANLLLLAGVLPMEPIVIVAWSLSYEMAFYLALPLLIGALRLRAWPAGARVGAMLATALLMLATEWQHGRMSFFACGMLLVEAMPALQAAARRGTRLDLAAQAALPGCAAVLLLGGDTASFAAVFATGFLLCAAAFHGTGPVARTLTWPPLRWPGNMSYSYYLLHGFVLDVLFRLLRALAPWLPEWGETAWWVLLPPAFLATLVGSAALFLLMERPFSTLPAGATGRPAAAPGLAATG